MKKPIVHLYTLCYNESLLLPYFLRHYLTFVDQITIFDNFSTDDSEKIAKSHEKVIFRKIDTENQINDNIFLNQKNHCWKESRGKADFVIVCDMDEFLFHPQMTDVLKHLKKEHYSLVHPFGFNMISETLPHMNDQIYEEIKSGLRSNWSDKMVLFDPHKIQEIKYEPGCHSCQPMGEIKIYRNEALKLLHYKYLNLDLILKKNKEYTQRLSAANRKLGWGIHYTKSPEEEKMSFKKMLEAANEVI